MTQAANLYVAAPPHFNTFWGVLKTRSHSWIYFSKDLLKTTPSLFSARTFSPGTVSPTLVLTSPQGLVRWPLQFVLTPLAPQGEYALIQKPGGLMGLVLSSRLYKKPYRMPLQSATARKLLEPRRKSTQVASVFLECHVVFSSCARKEVWSCTGRFKQVTRWSTAGPSLQSHWSRILQESMASLPAPLWIMSVSV